MHPPPALKISLIGNFGTRNIGNECTLAAMIANIRRLAPASDMTCICSLPDDVAERHGLVSHPMSGRAVSAAGGSADAGPPAHRSILSVFPRAARRLAFESREMLRMRRILKGRDMLIMTGTGMLADCGEGILGWPYDLFKWTVAAKIFRLKVLFVSVGVEPILRRVTRWFITSSLRLADYVSYRDAQSLANMRGIGFKKCAFVFPDLAFSLPEAPAPPRRETAEKPVVAVGLYDYRGRGRESEEALAAYRDYLEKLGGVRHLARRQRPSRTDHHRRPPV